MSEATQTSLVLWRPGWNFPPAPHRHPPRVQVGENEPLEYRGASMDAKPESLAHYGQTIRPSSHSFT